MYRTIAAHDYIDNLHIQESTYMAKLAKATDRYESGLWQGYLDQTKLLREFAEGWLEKVEQEAELVPTPSAEAWMEENQMAGDLRDFPAA
jgi:hypothetical protein